jgi:general secretion pathway protein D
MRYEFDGRNLAVMPDTPFLRTYKIDYVLMNRDTASTVSLATQIATAGLTATGTAAGVPPAGAGNSSTTRIENTARNRFWDTLVQNVKDILRETDKVIATETAPAAPGGERAEGGTERTVFREAAAVIANPETGVLTIRATARQHERIREFLDRVVASARREVLIEATVVEVQLSRNYQQGIDWSKLDFAGTGLTLRQRASGDISAPPSSLFELAYTSSGGSFAASIKLLEGFGDVRVLSSPKVSVLNNQTAVLKVVDNAVYFTIESNVSQNRDTTISSFNTTVHSVPVGFVMNVTPQISDSDSVVLNLRPSLSRIIGQATDPNPDLRDRNIVNNIPIIRSREIESVIRVDNGNIAVMGGLMEDLRDDTDNAVPLLSRVPLVGELFVDRNDTGAKTELVIFLRPTVIHEASIDGDFRNLAAHLPTADFLDRPRQPGLARPAAPAASERP